MNHHQILLLAFATVCLLTAVASAQVNSDEAKVPEYTLPDPLVTASGQKVTDAQMWRDVRRPEILELFKTQVYGRSPGKPQGMKFEQLSVDLKALGGKAIRKQVRVHFSDPSDGPKMDILIYLPAGAAKSVPTFVALNFHGNHSINKDPGIILSTTWMRNDTKRGNVNHKATEKTRGASASRWPVETILARGYAVATIYCGDIDPDFHDGFKNGVHSLDTQAKRSGESWGTISAWAWGLSRAMDYFETDPQIDHSHVALLGHSRLGKTSLWAGAQDERFALVISNDSGCGGAALSRRRFGETVKIINNAFPHWFCDNFKKYNGKEDTLPVDQHMLVALIAPRPAYVASAEQDRWADPRGEFLSVLGADPVYRLLGTKGLGASRMPAVNQPVAGTLGYHIRTGKHDVTDFDWENYLNFADKHFGRTAKSVVPNSGHLPQSEIEP